MARSLTMLRMQTRYVNGLTIRSLRDGDTETVAALFARLRAHLSEPQVVELTAAVALENFRSKFNVPLGVEAQGFCVLR